MAVITIAAVTLAFVKVLDDRMGGTHSFMDALIAIVVLALAPTIIVTFPLIGLWRFINRRK
jgi:hypothetical protein